MKIEINNEKELQELLDGSVEINIYHCYENGGLVIDKEEMKREFDVRVNEIIEAIKNY